MRREILPEAPCALREQPVGIDGLLMECLRVRRGQRDIAETVEDVRPYRFRVSRLKGWFRPMVRLRWSSSLLLPVRRQRDLKLALNFGGSFVQRSRTSLIDSPWKVSVVCVTRCLSGSAHFSRSPSKLTPVFGPNDRRMT